MGCTSTRCTSSKIAAKLCTAGTRETCWPPVAVIRHRWVPSNYRYGALESTRWCAQKLHPQIGDLDLLRPFSAYAGADLGG